MFRYCGRIPPNSIRHSPRLTPTSADRLTFSTLVYDAWTNQFDIPQYADIIRDTVKGYAPNSDCSGAFMMSNHQIDNNCYAYACCIATSTYPQPGRATPHTVNLLDPNNPSNLTADNVQSNAQADGLVYQGTALPSAPASPEQGHLVALLFSKPWSPPGGDPTLAWTGDYHFVRCDDQINYASWSHKPGEDQVVNYDFSGVLITDPSTANWNMNYRAWQNTLRPEYEVSYSFVCYMWVPWDTQMNLPKVGII